MDLSALIIVLLGTLLFVGFAVYMAFYSRRDEPANKENEMD
jgi:cell division protein FtsX